MTPASRQRTLDRWSNVRQVKRRKELQRRKAVKAKPAHLWDAMSAHISEVEQQLYGEASPSVVVTAEPPSATDTADRTAPAITITIPKSCLYAAERPEPAPTPTITINGQEVPATIVKGVVP